ncbi:hypothetical protein Hanom_Chr10g00954871 [Helianthus anomalus]
MSRSTQSRDASILKLVEIRRAREHLSFDQFCVILLQQLLFFLFVAAVTILSFCCSRLFTVLSF